MISIKLYLKICCITFTLVNVKKLNDLAGELVYTADKYHLEDLNMNNEQKLISLISVDNCIDLLKLSDAHFLKQLNKINWFHSLHKTRIKLMYL